MKAVHIIGVPLDLGGNRRGVDMGPSAFRIAGLGERIAGLGCTVVDKGDLPAPIAETHEARDERKKYVREIAKVCQKLYETALEQWPFTVPFRTAAHTVEAARVLLVRLEKEGRVGQGEATGVFYRQENAASLQQQAA